MVTTRTSSKKSRTGSTPPTSYRDLTGQPKLVPGSPCSITKKTVHKRGNGGHMLGGKKLMKDMLSPEKSKNETAPGSSTTQSSEFKIFPKFFVTLKRYE